MVLQYPHEAKGLLNCNIRLKGDRAIVETDSLAVFDYLANGCPFEPILITVKYKDLKATITDNTLKVLQLLTELAKQLYADKVEIESLKAQIKYMQNK